MRMHHERSLDGFLAGFLFSGVLCTAQSSPTCILRSVAIIFVEKKSCDVVRGCHLIFGVHNHAMPNRPAADAIDVNDVSRSFASVLAQLAGSLAAEPSSKPTKQPSPCRQPPAGFSSPAPWTLVPCRKNSWPTVGSVPRIMNSLDMFGLTKHWELCVEARAGFSDDFTEFSVTHAISGGGGWARWAPVCGTEGSLSLAGTPPMWHTSRLWSWWERRDGRTPRLTRSVGSGGQFPHASRQGRLSRASSGSPGNVPGGAAGGLGAGVRSGAAGKLVASERAASGNGDARGQGRHVRGLGKHWDTGDGETRWDAESADEMSRAG